MSGRSGGFNTRDYVLSLRECASDESIVCVGVDARRLRVKKKPEEEWT